MKIPALVSQFQQLGFNNPTANSPPLIPIKAKSHIKHHQPYASQTKIQLQSTKNSVKIKSGGRPRTLELAPISEKASKTEFPQMSPHGYSRFVIFGAVSIGVVLVMMGMDEHKALALGPEGPLVEEFWDNMRRYALYALTVSTGALYTILLPIVELLKNPISAVLILVIFVGGLYIISQVLYAMVGVSEFNYDYGY